MTEAKEEKLPISDFYKVVDHVTIFKSEKWWEAIVVFESYGKRQIGMYLWQKGQTGKRKPTERRQSRIQMEAETQVQREKP